MNETGVSKAPTLPHRETPTNSHSPLPDRQSIQRESTHYVGPDGQPYSARVLKPMEQNSEKGWLFPGPKGGFIAEAQMKEVERTNHPGGYLRRELDPNVEYPDDL
jgi:hypothetical protein